MKSFLITLLFFSIAVVAYSQTSLPDRGSQGYKSCFNNAAYAKSFTTPSSNGQQSKNSSAVSLASYRNDAPVISVMPALKLWLLPAALPNPFMKEED